MINKLERELLSAGSAEVATALSPEAAKIKSEEFALRRQLLERLRHVKAKGRIVIHLDYPEKLKGTPYDIVLEDGDSLYIPPKSSTIQVVGEVYNQSAFIFKKGEGIDYYLKLAGGLTPNADESHIYVLKVDGSLKRVPKHFRWLRKVHLDPGDTIVVPQKIEKIAWLRNIKDITTILYQIAVTTGVIITVF